MAKPIYQEAPAPPPRRPLLVGDGEVQAAMPQLEPRHPRLLTTHPKRWGVIAGRVVPLCGSLHLRPGVHMIRQRTDGRYMAREAQADLTEKGWTIIPEDVDGPGTSYVREVIPGTWLLSWEHEHPGSDHVSSDTDGYAEWLDGLVKAGKIPGPQPYVLDALAAKMRHQLGELRDLVRAHPSRQPELDRCEADLAALEARIGALRPARKSAPAKKALLTDEDSP